MDSELSGFPPEHARALALAKGLAATASAIESVSLETGVEAARWAFLQWELRAKAAGKFELADQMLFDRDGLEMATHERVAAFRAARYHEGSRVADLTCGIGADLIALARRGNVVGFEVDAQRAAMARHNLSVHGLSGEVVEQDCLGAAWDFEYAFADPSRRPGGRRTLNPADFLPDPVALAQRFEQLKLGAIKLSPMLADSFLESLGGRLEFLSYGGECREALVWLGREAVPGRYAVHVESGERLEAGEPGPLTEEPGEWLLEADPAAIRAHGLGTLSSRFNLRELGDSNGYLTGEPAASPWLRSFRVLHHGPADLKRTTAALRELGAGTPELKQRGAGQDLIALRKKLKREGSRRVALAIWVVGKSLRHTVLELP